MGYLGKKALAKSDALRVSFNSLLRPLISSSKFQFILKPLCILYSSGRDLSYGAQYYMVNTVVRLEFQISIFKAPFGREADIELLPNFEFLKRL